MVSAIAADADGRMLAVAETKLDEYRRGRVRLFPLGADGKPGDPVVLDTSDLRPVTRLEFSADGRTLAGASDRLAVLWELAGTGGALVPMSRSVLAGHAGTITDLAFDPPGRFLYTTSSDETVRVWSLATRETIHQFAPQYGTIQALALADHGRRIITGGDDKTAVVVENLADIGPARDKACSDDGRRSLTDAEATRVLRAVAAVDRLSFVPIVTRERLQSPIECPPRASE
jgi:WD40 repeat protein